MLVTSFVAAIWLALVFQQQRLLAARVALSVNDFNRTELQEARV